MSEKGQLSRRKFIAATAMATAGAALPARLKADFNRDHLQVWSCGGLAEAFIPANQRFQAKTGIKINYTGAFAAALGKSLLGSATTEVFAGRVLGLAQKLRKADKMIYFKPLCFTKYVMVTPVGNPAGISDLNDLGKSGVRVVLAPGASPPGGSAVSGLLKKAGVLESAISNCTVKTSCVQQSIAAMLEGQGDVSVVEQRITRMPLFQNRLEVFDIPETFFPRPPLTFTIGVMKHAEDRELADCYLDYILSDEGQSFFEKAGFIPALSAAGQRLIETLGIKDV